MTTQNQKLIGKELYSSSNSHWKKGVIKVKVLKDAGYMHVEVKSLAKGVSCPYIIPTPCLHVSEKKAIARMQAHVDSERRSALDVLERAMETLRMVEAVTAKLAEQR